MFASVTSVTLVGVEPVPVRVEVHLGGGRREFRIVGLPDVAVREAKERVRAAIVSSGYQLPSKRVVVNLAPADVPKAGSAYDLPIALGVLAADGTLRGHRSIVALGELALDGGIRTVRGGFGAAVVAKDAGRTCLLPPIAAQEGAGLAGAEVRAVSTLAAAVGVVKGESPGEEVAPHHQTTLPPPDLWAVRGQLMARRGLEIAAAGGHHFLMTGPPGGGKTMLARCLPGILPQLTSAEAHQVALAWTAAGHVRPSWLAPPFRSPHHSATLAALVGGGSGVPVPGEVTMAHKGVLFLDELGEFPGRLLDALRQPIEDGSVTIARKGASVCFPSALQVVAATNPCPCGYFQDRLVSCSCSPRSVERYKRKLSGPLADRFDLRITMERLESEELLGPRGESSAPVRARVAAARKRQHERGRLNRSLAPGELDDLAWEPGAVGLLQQSVSSRALTARGWDRIRRVAVTIADLAESAVIDEPHVAEALAFRGQA